MLMDTGDGIEGDGLLVSTAGVKDLELVVIEGTPPLSQNLCLPSLLLQEPTPVDILLHLLQDVGGGSHGVDEWDGHLDGDVRQVMGDLSIHDVLF